MSPHSSFPAEGVQQRAVELISVARDKSRERNEKRDKGELFNLLTTIRRGHLEVMTHSPILAELLRPLGSHDHGPEFLRLFLQRIGIIDFIADNATVERERSFGELGRIDIVLTDRCGRHVFIENKIGAPLQHEQLERYQRADPNAPILFLTLFGESPYGTDLAQVPKLKLVSYRDDIAQWLQACREIASTSPMVRESLTQYRNLVLQLTRQNLSTQMTKELADLVLKDPEALCAFQALLNAKPEVQRALADKLSAAVRAKLGDKIKLTKVMDGNEYAYDGFEFFVTKIGDVILDAVFSFEKECYDHCFFGFRCSGGRLPEESESFILLKNLFTEEFEEARITGEERGYQWPSWAYFYEKTWTEKNLGPATWIRRKCLRFRRYRYPRPTQSNGGQVYRHPRFRNLIV